MGADDELNLEEDWAIIRRQPTGIVLVEDRASNIKAQLLLASEKTAFDLTQQFQDRNGQLLTIQLLTEVISRAVRTFMEHWFDGLRNQDLAGLIEIVLEGQRGRLSPEEMSAFMRALPDSLLEKIATTAIGSGTGIHALIGVEANRRSGGPDYTLQAIGGSIEVSSETASGRITFSLFDKFTWIRHE